MSIDFDVDVEPCKCGHKPKIFTQFPVAKQKYQGIVECPYCGERIRGIQWHWDEDDAAEDAVEEWNKAMMETP